MAKTSPKLKVEFSADGEHWQEMATGSFSISPVPARTWQYFMPCVAQATIKAAHIRQQVNLNQIKGYFDMTGSRSAVICLGNLYLCSCGGWKWESVTTAECECLKSLRSMETIVKTDVVKFSLFATQSVRKRHSGGVLVTGNFGFRGMNYLNPEDASMQMWEIDVPALRMTEHKPPPPPPPPARGRLQYFLPPDEETQDE